MYWKILVDHIAEEDAKPGTNANAVGVEGPYGCDVTEELKYPFKMYDDDKILYYEGVCSVKDSEAPLMDFGMPNAGCTIIKY